MSRHVASTWGRARRSTAHCVIWRTKGTAVLVITSDLTEAMAFCDRLLVMREGRLVGELAGVRSDARAGRIAHGAVVSRPERGT